MSSTAIFEHHVPVTDGSLVVRELGRDGQPSLLLLHASGFHGMSYLPLVSDLKRCMHD